MYNRGCLSIFRSSSQPPKPVREKPKLSDQDRAILDLKLARDKLKRFQSKMETESSFLLKKAQNAHKVGNKTKAVYFMKIMKLKESKVDQLNGELLNIEKMVNTIEWTTQSMQVNIPYIYIFKLIFELSLPDLCFQVHFPRIPAT